MSMRELRKECEAGLADLPIPAPFSIPALVANMEEARGRTITLHELPDRLARVNAACGLRLKSGGTSFVLYRRRPTAYQTQHVISRSSRWAPPSPPSARAGGGCGCGGRRPACIRCGGS